MDGFELLTALCVGIGLAAATGFRVFVPLLVLAIAARSGHLTLASNVDWLTGDVALIALGAATTVEIAGYYVPWVDNLLDTIATPAAGIAGTIAASSVLTGMDPALQWSLGAIVGGGTALTVQGMTVGARALSTATTGGLGNAGVATAEAGMATGFALVALVMPLLAAGLVVTLIGLLARFIIRRWRGRRTPGPQVM